MKSITRISQSTVLLLVSILLLQGCLKDTFKRTYTMFTPVYKTSTQVRANIKSNSAKPIKNPGKLVLLGNYIFLNEVDKGIHVIDNSNPSSPITKYFIDIPGNVDLAVKGNTLYADLYTDLVTLDISDPTNVQVKKIINDVFPFRRYQSGFIMDSSKIIVDWISKDTTVAGEYKNISPLRGSIFMDRVSQFSGTSIASSAPTGISGSMARFTILNNYMYTVTDNSLNVFNITQPHDPLFSNRVNVGSGIETIYPFKGNLFIGSTAGMFIYQTTNPALPVRLGSLQHIRSCDPVIADDNYAYVTLRSGTMCNGFTNQLDVINIANLSAPTLVKTYPLQNPHGLSKDGNTLFVCDGKAGVKVFDAANVNAIKLLHTATGIDAYDVIAMNNLAIVIGKDGLYQYDYTNTSRLNLLSVITYKN